MIDWSADDPRSKSERKGFWRVVARTILFNNVAESAPRCGVARKTIP